MDFFSNPTFGVASQGQIPDVNLSGENALKKTTDKKAQSLRYPLRRIDSKSDYLEIQIASYEAPGFKPGSKDPTQGLADIGIGSEKNAEGKTKTKTYIYLPIPQNLSDTNSMTWGDDSLNPLEAFGLGLGIDTVQNAQNTGENVKRFLDAIGGIPGIDKSTINATIGAKLYNVLGGNVSTQSIITRATGQILNPNLELLFQGVNIRSFSFVFDFAPRDQREAREVKKIIRAFKESSAPRTKAIGKFGKVFIDSPDIFRLKFKTGRKEHPFLNRFKPMALTDMSLNYTASGTYATYQDGTPVHMQMSLTFKELNPVYGDDYEGVGGVGY